jgi:hypothetical protein
MGSSYGKGGRLIEYGHGYAVHTCVLRPRSIGEIRSTTGLVLEIDHRFFFSDEQDALTRVCPAAVPR